MVMCILVRIFSFANCWSLCGSLLIRYYLLQFDKEAVFSLYRLAQQRPKCVRKFNILPVAEVFDRKLASGCQNQPADSVQTRQASPDSVAHRPKAGVGDSLRRKCQAWQLEYPRCSPWLLPRIYELGDLRFECEGLADTFLQLLYV